MLKLTEILNDAKYSAFGSKSGPRSIRRFSIDSTRAENLLRPGGPFSDAAKNAGGKMYRLADRRREKGTTKIAEYEIIIPKKMERTSKDTANMYTVLLSRLPSWKGWPRRSFSVIFFLNRPTSSGDYEYGSDLYRVCPRNKAKIVVSPTPDLLNSHVFKHMEELLRGPHSEISDVQSFNGMMGNIVTYYQHAKEGLSKNPDLLSNPKIEAKHNWIKQIRYDNYDKAMQILDTSLNKKTLPRIQTLFDDAAKSSKFGWRTDVFIRLKDTFKYYVELVEKYGSWEGLLSEAFDPEKNGFQLMTPKNIHNTTSHNEVECWTEETCMLKHVSLWDPYDDDDEDMDSD